jgi:hypothetical protein
MRNAAARGLGPDVLVRMAARRRDVLDAALESVEHTWVPTATDKETVKRLKAAVALLVGPA